MQKKIAVFVLAACAIAAGGQEVKTETKPVAAKETKSAWFEKLTLKGDVRARYENIDKEGSPSRDRARIRARLRVEGQANDEVKAVIGMRTGGEDPVSGNQTLTDGFSSKDFGLDLGYVEWQPALLPGLSLIGGKMEKPFFQVSDLIWDSNLNPEGGALRYKLGLGDANMLANAAVLPVMERSKDSDTYIYAGQGGMEYKHASGFNAMAGASYYYYSNMKDFDVVDWSDSFNSYGNTAVVTKDSAGKVTKAVYADEYRELELMASCGFKCPLTGLPWSFYGNYVRNTEADDNDTGYLVGVSLGKTKDPRSFQICYDYRRLEADAVVGAFCDSGSWGGGTDGKGHRIQGAYQIAKNWTLGATYYIDEAGIKDGAASKDYKRFQLDLSAKF